MATDHEGRDVPENEPDDAVILVWEVTPHPSSRDYCSMVERSWQKMLEYVKGELDCMLERKDTDELLEEPFTISFGLQRMTKADYLAIVEDDD